MFHTPKIVVCCKQQKRLCHKCVSIDMRVSCNYKNFTVLLCVRFCFLSCVGWNHSHHHQQQLVLWLNLMVLIIMSYLRQNMTPLSIHTFGTDTHTHTPFATDKMSFTHNMNMTWFGFSKGRKPSDQRPINYYVIVSLFSFIPSFWVDLVWA